MVTKYTKNHLTLSGRLKRFVKISGEMISLPAMEEAIQKVYPPEDDKQKTALTYVEKQGDRPVITLCGLPAHPAQHSDGFHLRCSFPFT